jgi:hypothetical protein
MRLTSAQALDLVAFYPRALWQPPSSPLHFLVALREAYVGMSGDPFFAQPQHEPWFQAMLYIEAGAQLPLAAFLVSRLWSARLASSRRSSGAMELAAVAFGSLTGMGSLTCAYHLQQLGPEVVSAQQKASLLYGTYMPFAVIRTRPL